MSLSSRLLDLASAIGTDVKTIKTDMVKMVVLAPEDPTPDPPTNNTLYLRKVV